jgi:hypothetical protein
VECLGRAQGPTNKDDGKIGTPENVVVADFPISALMRIWARIRGWLFPIVSVDRFISGF